MADQDVPQRVPFRIVPIKHVDVYRSVLTQLEALISESGLRPGDRLGSERELAEQLNVSRVSVREALRALESMGKIEIRRNAGSFVVDPDGRASMAELKAVAASDDDVLQHLIDVRAAIEAKVVDVVSRHPAADLAAVELVLDRAEAELDRPGEAEAGSLDLRFEAALARAADNPLLAKFQRLVHRLWVDAWTEVGLAPADKRTLHAQHRAILAALVDGDRDRAIALMEEHVDRTVQLGERAPMEN